MVDGLTFDPKDKMNNDCKGCAMGKLNRLPFPKQSSHKSSQLLELIHTDVCGPMSIEQIGGSCYFVSFIDNYSRLCVSLRPIFIVKNFPQSPFIPCPIYHSVRSLQLIQERYLTPDLRYLTTEQGINIIWISQERNYRVLKKNFSVMAQKYGMTLQCNRC